MGSREKHEESPEIDDEVAGQVLDRILKEPLTPEERSYYLGQQEAPKSRAKKQGSVCLSKVHEAGEHLNVPLAEFARRLKVERDPIKRQAMRCALNAGRAVQDHKSAGRVARAWLRSFLCL